MIFRTDRYFSFVCVRIYILLDINLLIHADDFQNQMSFVDSVFCVHIDIFFFQIYILIHTVGYFQNQPSFVVSIFLCTHFYSFLSNVYILIHINDFQNQSSLVV